MQIKLSLMSLAYLKLISLLLKPRRELTQLEWYGILSFIACIGFDIASFLLFGLFIHLMPQDIKLSDQKLLM